ncbi:Uncharacterized protein QTN25_009082 [Entamoeba marina]
MLFFLLLITTINANVISEYDNRSKAANQDILIGLLKRQKSLRTLSKVLGGGLEFNRLLPGLIKRQQQNLEAPSDTNKQQTSEMESKQHELLHKMLQAESIRDFETVNGLRNEALVTLEHLDTRRIDKLVNKKQRLQRKSLLFYEKARNQSKKLLDSSRSMNQQQTKRQNKLKLIQKLLKISLKAVEKSVVVDEKLKGQLKLVRDEMSHNAVKNAQETLRLNRKTRSRKY